MGNRSYLPRKKEDTEVVYCMDFDLGGVDCVQPNMDIHIGGETSETNYTECRAGGLYLTDSPSGISGADKKREKCLQQSSKYKQKAQDLRIFPVCCSGRIKSTARNIGKEEPRV